ncbi:SlyX family protein [Aestuariibacter salexigens]|uniref:SlyX family protein n=1 Tax=Aestuariibacter salexigens TaxID=226010 RepID=UPI0003FEE0B6|nr:SlyX family protein [Aestuariibacter salexigens]
MSNDVQELQQHIDELQTKVAYQEHTIDQLNHALTSQQKQIDDMTFKLNHVIERLKQMPSSQIADLSEETPPPHY